MAEENTLKTKRLIQAIEWSREQLRPFRNNRMLAIKQYAGYYYGSGSTTDRVPINLVEMAVNIYTQYLAARSPRVMASTADQKLKSSATLLELAINHLLDEISFSASIRRIVRDALFSMGIVKVGLAVSDEVEIGGVFHDVAQPFADPVSLDDWVHDATARTFEEVGYAGNRYRVPLETIKANKLYDEKARDALTKISKTARNEAGDDKVEGLSRESGGEPDEYQDYAEAWDIWLPAEGLVVTFGCQESGGDVSIMPRPLRTVEWDGPESGPYGQLLFSEVPDNIMPLPPSAIWMDIHYLTNRLFLKLGRQAERQKTVFGYRAQAAEDARRLKDAGDGDGIVMDDPQGGREVRLGGIDPANMAFTMQLKDLFSIMSGNLDILGGLAPQSATLGQDQMLSEAASKRVTDMQDRVSDFVRQITKDLAWYLWTDPLINLPLVKRTKGSDIEIPVSFTPEQREGDFLDYNISIEPYSMQHQTPAMKLQAIQGVFTNFIAPYLPLLQQQGITIDFEGLLRTVGKLTNMTDLETIVTFAHGANPEQGGDPQMRAAAPAVTHRTNERISRPSGNQQTRAHNLMERLMFSNANGNGQGV